MNSYGMQYILDLGDINIICKKDMRKQLTAFCKRLCKQIDMERGPLHFWDYADDSKKDYDNAPDHLQGSSLVQFIQTSTITIHHRHRQKSVNVDVFSCKSFEPMVVLRECLGFFGGRIIKDHIFERN